MLVTASTRESAGLMLSWLYEFKSIVKARNRKPTTPTNLVDDREPFSVDNKERKNFMFLGFNELSPTLFRSEAVSYSELKIP